MTSIIVSVVVIANILACLWLIWWTAKKRPGDEQEGVEKAEVWDEDLRELNNPMPRWWLNLFVITIVFALAYLLLYPGLGDYAGTLAWSQTAQHDQRLAEVNARRQAHFAQFEGRDPAALAQDINAIRAAGRLFADNCAGCHGPSAEGAIGFPNLRDADWLYGGSPEQILHSIRQGRRGQMPAQLANLEAGGVDALVALLADWDAPALKPEAEAGARQQFAQRCAICHGAEAEGNVVIGAPNLRDDIWLHGADEEQIRHSIAFGRQAEMPAHEALLSEVEINLLSGYLLWLSAGVGNE